MHKHTIAGKETCIYADAPEQGAIDQFEAAMAQPWAIKGALMADTHKGYSLPIGGVVATDDMIVPAFVGYDIGCGVCALQTTFDAATVKEKQDAIYDAVLASVPVGFRHNEKETEWNYSHLNPTSVVEAELAKGALRQLGTLGGGNHFIEIGQDQAGKVWFVIHSGSRNLGHRVAEHYMRAASPDGRASEGCYGLQATSEAGREYLRDLEFGLAFALRNRKEMLMRMEKALQSVLPGEGLWSGMINRNHNHAEKDKDGLWVHRKGATHAELGMDGVIPGNMRDGSFIVRGKGNPDSLCSSSHGAGRVLGRMEAKRTLDLQAFIDNMAKSGIKARVDAGTLDESPEAYKNIWEVMAQQTELVEVLHHVTPLVNIKGGKD